MDFAKPVDLGFVRDYVVSLEVGEHIPQEYESTFIQNLINAKEKGIILSWAIPNQPGRGHVNCRSNEYIRDRFHRYGLKSNYEKEDLLRNAATMDYFKNTIMVFEQ